MKRILRIALICLFTLFSFYYTDKIIYLSRLKDPIMIKINQIKKDLNVKSINGVLTKNTMLVGSSGKKINEEKSYEKMKKVNTFNENLLEYENIKPVIDKKSNLDKLIKGKKTSDNTISFIFKLDSIGNLEQIIYILNTNKVKATFFIDGLLVEQNISQIKDVLNNNNIGFYGYNDKNDILSVKYIKGLYKNNNLNISNYCLYKDKTFLDSCISSKINTVDPDEINSNLYNYIKNNKAKGYIYLIDDNSYNIRQLNSTIIYLKNKGYDLVTIDELLKE